jgi:AbiU2
MSSPSDEFEAQLELFRTESSSAIQYFYAWDATHAVASKNKSVVKLLDQAPLFWNTALGALQAATFMALGRVFDPDQKNHSVTRLLSFGHSNLNLFSKDALSARKRRLSDNADEWLPRYLEDVYVPNSDDFRRLKGHVAKNRKIYELNYRPLRHKVFAHRAVVTPAEVGQLSSNANLSELRQLLVFLGGLHEALWQLYFNGRKPTLKSSRFSVDRMLVQPSPRQNGRQLQERLVHETSEFFKRQASSCR